MKTNAFRIPALMALLIAITGFAACSHEVSHTESDKPGWFGGRTRTETTTYQNPDGTTSTESSRQTTH